MRIMIFLNIYFKQRHDEFVKEYEMAMGDKMLLSSDDEIITQQSEKPFKAIQGMIAQETNL